MKEHKKSKLDSIILAYPCPIDWDSMDGDERKRFCEKCSSNVFNISDMSSKEAEEFLSENETACVRFYARPDGTITTAECWKFFKPVVAGINRLKKAASIAVMFLISSMPPGFSKQTKNNEKIYNRPASFKLLKENVEEILKLGWPAPDSVKEALDRILNAKPDNENEKQALQSLKNEIASTRTINRDKLTKLSRIYDKQGEPGAALDVLYLETLLDLNSPVLGNYKWKQIEKFERERNLLLSKIVSEAESYAEQGKSEEALSKIYEFMRVARLGREINNADVNLPSGVKRWKLHTTGIAAWQPYLVTSDNLIDRVAHVLKTLDPITQGTETLCMNLELSKLENLILEKPENKQLKKQLTKLRIDIYERSKNFQK